MNIVSLKKKSAAEPEREKGALASGDATVQLSQQGRAEFNSKPGTSNSNQGPQVPKGPKEGTVPVQGDIKRAANPTGRRRPFQRITKGFKRMFA